MATITKEKNYILYTNDDGKVYKFDVNTGILYSLKGLPMKSFPKGYVRCIHENHSASSVTGLLYFLLYRGCKGDSLPLYQKQFNLVDRLNSVGVAIQWWDFSRIVDDDEFTDFLIKNFKEFVKMRKEDEDLSIYNFYQQYSRELIRKSLGIKVDEYYTEEILDTVSSWHNYFNLEELRLVAYYLARGANYIFNDYYVSREKFRKFFEVAKLIGYTPEKSDFFRQYFVVFRTYETNKTALDSKAIQEHLAKHSNVWEFEDEEFCIVVPSSAADFKTEADYQHNCVYNMYLPRVIRGETNVVFIRRKEELDTPYITCEVNNRGDIIQYLKKFNRSADAEDERNFKKKFDNFIKANW